MQKTHLPYVLSFGNDDVVVELTRDEIKIATKNGRTEELQNTIIDVLRIKTI